MEEPKKFLLTMNLKIQKLEGKKMEAAYFAKKFSEGLKPENTYVASKLQNTHQSSCSFFWVTYQFVIEKMAKFSTFS